MFKIGDTVRLLEGTGSGHYDRFRKGTEGVIDDIQAHPTMGVVYEVPQSGYIYPAERLELVSLAEQSVHRHQVGDMVTYYNNRVGCYESGIVIRVMNSALTGTPPYITYTIRTSEGERSGITEDELMSAEYSLF